MLSNRFWQDVHEKIISMNKNFDFIDWNIIYSTYYSQYLQLDLKKKYRNMERKDLINLISYLIYAEISQNYALMAADSELQKNLDIIQNYETKQITETNSHSNTQNDSITDPFNFQHNTYASSAKSESDNVSDGRGTVTNQDKSKILNSLDTIRKWLNSNNIYEKILDKLLPLYITYDFSDCYCEDFCLCGASDETLTKNDVINLINESLDRIKFENESDEKNVVKVVRKDE